MKTTRLNIPTELIEQTNKWLGKDGIAFFKEMKEKYDEYSPVFLDGGIPHPVHFREGMRVRNFMRTTGLCKEWSCQELDDNWVHLIDAVMKGK